MSELMQQGFNYGQLAPVEAAEVRAASERIKIRMKRTAEDIVAIGQDLIATKERLGHGRFGEWIAAEFDMSDMTAKRLMQVADRFGKSNILFDFKPSILYSLAAPSTPDEVVGKVIEAKQAGESVTTADVKKWKEEAQIARAEAEQERLARIQQQEAEEKAQQTLARAREEYSKLQREIAELKNKPPQVIEREVEKEVIPSPYVSLEQALECKRNLIEEAEARLNKANAEFERVKVDSVAARQEAERIKNERTVAERQRVILSSLKHNLLAFIKNNEENFHELDTDYIQAHDMKTLERISESLHRMTELVDGAIGGTNDYAEFRVVNG